MSAMMTDIEKRFNNHPQSINEKSLLAILSNKKMNSCLKEIVYVFGNTKPLLFTLPGTISLL